MATKRTPKQTRIHKLTTEVYAHLDQVLFTGNAIGGVPLMALLEQCDKEAMSTESMTRLLEHLPRCMFALSQALGFCYAERISRPRYRREKPKRGS